MLIQFTLRLSMPMCIYAVSLSLIMPTCTYAHPVHTGPGCMKHQMKMGFTEVLLLGKKGVALNVAVLQVNTKDNIFSI